MYTLPLNPLYVGLILIFRVRSFCLPKKAQKINGDKLQPKLIYYIDVGLTNSELQLVVGHLVSLQGTNANIDSKKQNKEK